MKKRLPLGVSDFKKIITKEYYYVDKTLLVEEIYKEGEAVLLTRPRRFGKTLNLSMLKYFFEKNDESTSHLFENLKIFKKEEYRNLQGTFPVIFLSFRSGTQSNFHDLYEHLCAMIAQEFNRHRYLLEGTILQPFEKEYFEKIQQGKGTKNNYSMSLKNLSEFLFRSYNKPVILLIDEYDIPVQSAFINNYYEEILEFVRPLLTLALKDNPALEKAVLTGILALAKAGIFSGLNNLSVYNLTQERFSDMFGFTQEEAEALLKYYKIDSIDEVQTWYNGYTFGQRQAMFNPWSMLSCIQNNSALETYWANTSSDILLKRLIINAKGTTKAELELLLGGNSLNKAIEESIIFTDIEKQPDLLWSFLLFTGYLTYTSYERQRGVKQASLIIPNKEIQYLFEKLIKKIISETLVNDKALELLDSMLTGKHERFQTLLQEFILNSMSAYDLPSNEPEKSYHLFTLGLMVLLHDKYTVISNRESGFGRYDTMIVPKRTQDNAVVIEFKKVRPEQKRSLEQTADEALKQILDKKYFQDLLSQGISNIFAYGIAFQGKHVFIKKKIISQ